MPTPKEAARQSLEHLPDQASWDDISILCFFSLPLAGRAGVGGQKTTLIQKIGVRA